MAKRGGTRHLKRIAIPKEIPIHDKKESRWLIRPSPGSHSFQASLPLAVLLRDMLKVTRSMKETHRVLHQRLVLVDGKVRTEPKFPIGFMDIVDIPKLGKTYRLVADSHGRLMPVEIPAGQKQSKLARVEKRFVVPGHKLSITLHDGKTLLAPQPVKVGDTVRIRLPDPVIENVLPLSPGVRCFVREGRHAGTIAMLEEIIHRKEGKAVEARLKTAEGDFITVVKYLFVVDDTIATKA